MPPQVIAAVAAGVSAVGTVVSIIGQQKAATAAKKAARAQANQQALELQRTRLEAIRKARQERAASLQGSANTGAGVSTESLGAAASIEGQLEANLGFLGNTQANALTIFRASEAQRSAEGMIRVGENIKSIASMGSSFSSTSEAGKKKKLDSARTVG